jgi:hypothetical protein
VARKEAKQEEAKRSSPISISTHSGSTKEEEEAPVHKKRKDKEKVLKKKKDAKKKQKIEANKAKVEAEAKITAEREKEIAEATRVVTELAKKAADKFVEEERQRKNAENREDGIHPMDLDIPGTSTTGTKAETTSSGEPFRPAEVLDFRTFTCDSKTNRIVQERVKKMLVIEGAPILVVTQVLVKEDVKEDLVATARANSAFMDTTIDNIQRLCQQNEEKEARIRELKERLQQVKIYERSLLNFKASA